MASRFHKFTDQQTAFLQALAAGTYQGGIRPVQGPRAVSLVDKMPPVHQQALCGTCVSHAVTALLEYYGDCRVSLSVQFLYVATKEIERAGIEENLLNLRAGKPLNAGFESVFHAELLQLRMLADANGGITAPAVRPYLLRFEEGARSRFAAASGSLLMSCFRAVETVGVCRSTLWPYAAVPSAPLFGREGEGVKFPPGSREDAAKRRLVHGLYLLGTPNNVDEIRGILAGANGHRAMPVAVTVDFFADCDGETYAIPAVETNAEGQLVSKNEWRGRHGLLVVGYEDNESYPGGGFFLIRNSLGEGWGRRGYGKLPYAYLECFAVEAGTILQDQIDYDIGRGPKSRRGRRVLLNLVIAALLVGGTMAVGVIFNDPLHLRKKPDMPVVPNIPPVDSPVPQTGLEAKNTVYKVFFSCANADERRALRTALASEGVPFAVEFLPQTLETVLAVRVTLAEENVPEAITKVFEKYYSGPRREFWTDVDGLGKSRSIYIVKAAMRRWEGGL